MKDTTFNKKALVLAGGFSQITLIEDLKRRGFYTLLADYAEQPIARQYADRFYQVSTLDIDAIRNIAKQENVDFLITACTDQALLTVARVSEDLGLPCYIDYQTALNVTNKEYMKKIFSEYGIPTAEYIVAHSETDIEDMDMEYPVIVKPANCNSSRGVRKVDTFQELKEAFSHAADLSRSHTVVIEKYIEGPEISVDAYVENGVAHVLCLSDLDKIKEKGKFIIFRSLCPSEYTLSLGEKIQDVAQKIVEAFKLRDTPMLIQLIADKGEVKVLEFSARTAGGFKHLWLNKVSGVDVIKAVIDLTLGEKPHVDHRLFSKKYVADEFIYCKPGKYDHLEGFEELKKQGIITYYHPFKWKGAEFITLRDNGDRVAGYTIVADSLKELSEKHDCVATMVKVLAENGADIMRHDLLAPIHRMNLR